MNHYLKTLFVFVSIFFRMVRGSARGQSKLESDLPSIPLSHGLHLPMLGLGTAGLREDTPNIVFQALAAGVRMIDTAQATEWYSEEGVAKGLKLFRDSPSFTGQDIVLVTKVHPRHFKRELLRKKVQQSRRILNTPLSTTTDNLPPLDVVLLHSPRCWTGHCNRVEQSYSWEEGWSELEQLKEDGEVLTIGVSNFDLDELERLMEIANTKVNVIQNWMDPFHQDTEVRKFAQENGIAYMTYSSFGTQWEGKLRGNNPVMSSETLTRIATKHNCSVADVVTSWVIEEGAVAIPRSSSVEHVRKNAVYHPSFLDEQDMKDIRALDGTLGTPWD